MNFAVFSGFFLKVGFLHKKRDTRAILLKTALVHVSCIQNTQIRGETIAKGFEKVDTFWTYHICATGMHIRCATGKLISSSDMGLEALMSWGTFMLPVELTSATSGDSLGRPALPRRMVLIWRECASQPARY
jgi:hypothetical protein